MKLTILIDNNSLIDRYLLSEPGLSILIEDCGDKTLLDTGYSGVFLDNALSMGIDPAGLDRVVLSHGHNDHCGGLERLMDYRRQKGCAARLPLICHPLALKKKVTEAGQQIGMQISWERLQEGFCPILSRESLWLTPKLAYLGQIERRTGFENLEPVGRIMTSPEGEDDYLPDDTALAYKSEKGLVIITGCSHSGICNIISQAKEVCNEDRIFDIVGGFHLLAPPPGKLDRITDFLRTAKPACIHPCHCTDFRSRAELYRYFKVEEAGTSTVLEY